MSHEVKARKWLEQRVPAGWVVDIHDLSEHPDVLAWRVEARTTTSAGRVAVSAEGRTPMSAAILTWSSWRQACGYSTTVTLYKALLRIMTGGHPMTPLHLVRSTIKANARTAPDPNMVRDAMTALDALEGFRRWRGVDEDGKPVEDA